MIFLSPTQKYPFVIGVLFGSMLSCQNHTTDCHVGKGDAYQRVEVYQTFYRNEILEIFSVDNCLLEGPYIGFHTGNNFAILANYENDTLEGMKYSFYPDGGVASVEHFVHGVKSGKAKYYNPAGQMIKICEFLNGQLVRCVDTNLPGT